jgi:WD40 repeat protein
MEIIVEWDKTFGGIGSDRASSIIQTNDGSFAVAGVTWSKGAGGPDFWVIKLDANGNQQWDKIFGGSNLEIASSIIQTTDGGFAVAGRTYSIEAGKNDVWVIKLDANGNQQWDKTFGGNSDDGAHSIIQTTDGGFAIAGETKSKGAGYSDVWIIKLDPNGNQQWDKTFGGSVSDSAYSIIQTTDGGFAVAGITYSIKASAHDVWVIKLDPNGNQQWDKTFGGSRQNSASSIIQTNDGGFAVAGGIHNDVWVIKLDSNGNLLWGKTFGGSSDDIARSIIQTDDGGFVVAGETKSKGAGYSDVWIIKLDPNGNQQWDKTFGGSVSDSAYSIIQTTDGGFAVAGSTGSTISKGAGQDDFWVIKFKTNLSNQNITKLIRTFSGHTYGVASVAFSPDGRFALSGSSDKTMKLWDVASGNEIRTFNGHSGYVSSVTFSADGHYALSGSWDNTLKLWDVESGNEIRTFNGHSGYVYSVAFSPDDHYALSGSDDKTMKLWDLESGNEIHTFSEHSEAVISVTFSPDSRFALSGSWDNTLKLWDVESGNEIRTFSEHAYSVSSVTFSPDGRFALSGSYDGTFKLWDVESGSEIRTINAHSLNLISIAFSPDSRFALSGASDDAMKLWDVASGDEIRTFSGHSEGVNSVAFSPDGRYALSGSSDKTLKLWETGLTMVSPTSNVKMLLNKKSYQIEEQIILNMEVGGQAKVDLYVAIVFPDGNYMTIAHPLEFSQLNAIQAYQTKVQLDGNKTYSIMNFLVPGGIPIGNYQACGVLTTAGSDPHEQNNWLQIHCEGFVVN